jgi:sugar phosphate permease
MFLVGGIVLFLVTIMFIFMKVSPKDAGINYDTRAKLLEHHEEIHGSVDDSIKENIAKGQEEQGNITFTQALKIPHVLNYAIIYMNCKGIVYAIIFWLPTYLINTIQFDTVNLFVLPSFHRINLLGCCLNLIWEL